MADNIELNAGTGGDTIATDDAGAGGQVQVVKLAVSADGSRTHLTADNTNGLLVDVSRVGGTVTVDASGAAVPVTDNGGTLTVDGTVAVTNAGLTELAAAIDTELQVDVVGALPAGDNNIGNVDIASAIPAGTNNIGDVDVLSIVPGVAATNLGKAEDAAHTSGDVGVMALSVRQDAAAALGQTDADYQPLITDASGRLHCNVGNTVTVGSHAVTNAGTFAVQVDNTVTVGSHAVTNAGTFAVQVDGSALTALQVIDNPVLVDDAAFTPATSSVTMAGFQADEGSTDSVDEGDAGAARMTLDRKVIVTAQPHTAGGLSIHRSIDLDEGTLEVVKNAPGQVYGMWAANTATATRFIKFYDATSGTAGTGTPVLTIPIPGNASDDIGGVFSTGGLGITFATGICVGATTAVADADTGAPGANEVIVNIFYA